MTSVKQIKDKLCSQYGLTEEAANVAAPAIMLRNAYVEEMASTSPMSPEWNEASKKITECDCILAQFGLV